MGLQVMVHKPNGAYVELKVGFGQKIYLDRNEIGFKVGGDGYIYTNSGTFVSKLSVEEFCKLKGLIKWFFNCKKIPQSGIFAI